MPRSKRKREGETAPPPSRRRGGGREPSGAEPVGRKTNEGDSEETGLDANISAMEETQKDPLESSPPNNRHGDDAVKDQGNGSARNGKSGDGNDHAEPLKENATKPLHEKEEKQDDAMDVSPQAATTVQGEKQNVSKSLGEKSDSRIQAILEHRRLLLTRLQQGRAVVRSRLDLAYKKNPGAKEQNDEQEIVAFQMLAKEATSLA